MALIIRIILLILFVCSNSYAQQNRQHYVYVLNNFSKGLNTQTSDYLLPPNQLTEAQNVRINIKAGAISKRKEIALAYTAGSSDINGIHRYYLSNGTQTTIIAGSTKLYKGNDLNGATTVLTDGLTDGKRWQFVTYKDIAIGVNGSDQPIKYDNHSEVTADTDGARTDENLVAELGAPFAELNTGTNLQADSWYQYIVGFNYDGTNTSYSLARSNPILTGSTVHNIKLTDIPFGQTGTTERYIYRSLGQSSKANVKALDASEFYLVATISDNITQELEDNVSDSTASTAQTLETFIASAEQEVTPPKGKFIIIQKERIFIAGDENNKSNIYWSDIFNPDYFLDDSFERIRPDDGDEITFIKTLLGTLTIGKTNTIQKFYTDGNKDVDWYVSDPFTFVGCAAPYSVANSPIGIVYLSHSGIYVFNGQSSIFISDSVTPEILDISPTSYNDVAGEYWKNEYYLAYASIESGAIQNNRVLVYDFIRDAYVIDYKNANCFEVFSSGDDEGLLCFGSSKNDGYVYFNETSGTSLIKRTKTELTLGVFDDTRVLGTEDSPYIELAWDCTIDTWDDELLSKSVTPQTIDQVNIDIPDAIIDRPDTDGTWTSPVYEINAGTLDKLYWNETTKSVGDITFNIRTGSANPIVGAWSSDFIDPNGSDISSVTGAQYLQVKANLSTTNIAISPNLIKSDNFVFKLEYKRSGTNIEDTISSVVKTGWLEFSNAPRLPKLLTEIRVFYQADSGSMEITYEGDEGFFSDSFTIDMSIEPDASKSDRYDGTDGFKVYTHQPVGNEFGQPPLSKLWRIRVVESGDDEWTLSKIEIRYSLEEMDDRWRDD